MIAPEALSLTSLVFWILLTLDRKRSWPAEMVLPDASKKRSEDGLDSVVAIVPARDEAETLTQTLPALLQQDLEDFRVVVVDDGSTDGTADVARRLGGELDLNPRLEVVKAGPRKEGWSGKVHALSCGYAAILEGAAETGSAPPEWLLLTDADIEHRPGSVRSLLQQVGHSGTEQPFDLISIMARLRAESFWERLVVPAFVFFFQLLYPFRRVADRHSRIAAAAGGCVLVRRSVLEAAGGLAVISGEIIDDVALGRAIKQTGTGVWLGFDPDIASVRGYPGLMGLWRMVSRTAFTQIRYRWDLLLLTVVAMGIFFVSPPVIFAASLVRVWISDPADPGSWLRAGTWAILAWILMSMAYLPAVRHHRISPSFAAMLPIAGLLLCLMTVSSALDDLRGKGPTWRGRSYEASRRGDSRPSR